ncbi:MAG: 50S ribosomal protein L17 [Planctomycetota bacterium]|nr:MAG: 50S ribosomal protein L17 [Planctomycetota bacterium]
MRHRKKGRKLGRNCSHRLALRRNLMRGLFLSPDLRICTTLPKAKEVKPYVEKMISLARVKSLHTYKRALSLLPDEGAVARLFNEIAPPFAESGRPGGYTRILKRAKRRLGDNGQTAFLQIIQEGADRKKKRRPRRLSLKRKAKGETAPKREGKSSE